MLQQPQIVHRQNNVLLVLDLRDISVNGHTHGTMASDAHVRVIDVVHERVATAGVAVVIAEKVKVAVIDEVAVAAEEVEVIVDEVGVEANTEDAGVGFYRTL